MIKRLTDIPNFPDLVANLEEFGLSKYESMAYITLLSKGTLGASEIAYYANLPRTKIYTTLKKLERKKLSTIANHKPMIATAASPVEALGELITMQQRRLQSMQNILDTLKKLKEDGKKTHEEKRYLIMEPNSVVRKIAELISSAKSSVYAILDSWGRNVVFQSRTAISDAAGRGIKVNLLLSTESIINEPLGMFPNGVEIRSDNIWGNILIFDFKTSVFIDSANGKASLISTSDPIGTTYLKFFEEKWKKALRINRNLLSNKIPKEALILSHLVENDLSQILLDFSIKQDNDYSRLLYVIEKYGADIKCQSIADIITVVDNALKICYSGYLKYESQNNMLKIHFDLEEKSILPWALIIMAYIKKFGSDANIFYDKDELNGNTIYIKLLNPSITNVN